MRQLNFLACLFCAAGLAACVKPVAQAPLGLHAGGGRAPVISNPITSNYVQIVDIAERKVAIDSAGRPVVAVAPDGFCIPRDAIQSDKGVVFILMDRCNRNAGTPGVLSLSITSAPPPDMAALEAHLKNGEGLAALGYGGPASDVSLTDSKLDPDALYVSVTDRGAAAPPYAGELIERAFVPLNGRLAVATLVSLKKSDETSRALRMALRDVVSALHAANPSKPTPGPVVAAKAGPGTGNEEDPGVSFPSLDEAER